MRAQILIIPAILILFLSCEKVYLYADARIKGTVYDSTTFETIADADVTVYRQVHCRVVGIEFCEDWEVVKTEKSDEDGEYFVKFNDKDREYRISAAKEGYYKSGYWYKVSKDIEHVDLYLFPQGTLSLAVKNTNPYDESDLLELDISNQGNRDVEVMHFSFQGTDIDTTIGITLYANFTHQLDWRIVKDTTERYFQDSIFCNTGDNNYYHITY